MFAKVIDLKCPPVGFPLEAKIFVSVEISCLLFYTYPHPQSSLFESIVSVLKTELNLTKARLNKAFASVGSH